MGQRFAGGAAILLVAALIAFMLDDGEPKNVRAVIPVEVDADLAKWLEKEALRIRKETSTQKSAPTVVRHFERNPDPVKEFVEVTVTQGLLNSRWRKRESFYVPMRILQSTHR